MLQIDDTIISLDLLDESFVCDLNTCKGKCCIEGDDGEPVTSIVNGDECVFTYTDESGICKCAIEKAFREGKTDFYKPVSCHLYPVRLQKYEDYVAVNYHRWSVCNCARKLGGKLGVPVYKFLKEPLIRRFGTEWYEQLEIADEELKNRK